MLMTRPPVENHLQAGRIAERGAVGLGALASPARRWVMRPSSDSAPVSTSRATAREIAVAPFGGDADPRLAHEGGREGEADAVGRSRRARSRRPARAARSACRAAAASPLTSIDRAVVAARVVVGRRAPRSRPRRRARVGLRLPDDRRLAAAATRRAARAAGRARRGRRSVAAVAAPAPASACSAVAASASSTPLSPSDSATGTTRAPGTTRREAAPPNRPRTSPKQRAPGTNTRSPTATPRRRRRPRRRGRPIRSRAPADSPCRESAACGRSRAAARCRC